MFCVLWNLSFHYRTFCYSTSKYVQSDRQFNIILLSPHSTSCKSPTLPAFYILVQLITIPATLTQSLTISDTYLRFYLHESEISALWSSPTGKYRTTPQYFSLVTWQNKITAASGLEVVRYISKYYVTNTKAQIRKAFFKLSSLITKVVSCHDVPTTEPSKRHVTLKFRRFRKLAF
jgi:hypothetical protein